MKYLIIALALYSVLMFGVARAQMGITFFPGPGMVHSSGGGSCTGTIDLSQGCALPMLGGAP